MILYCFKVITVNQIVADNPRESYDYMLAAAELLEKGGTITVRGQKSNRYFNRLLDHTMPGLEQFEVYTEAREVSEAIVKNMTQTDGKPIVGTVYEIVYKKK